MLRKNIYYKKRLFLGTYEKMLLKNGIKVAKNFLTSVY